MSSDTHQNFSWAASGDGGQTSDWGGGVPTPLEPPLLLQAMRPNNNQSALTVVV